MWDKLFTLDNKFSTTRLVSTRRPVIENRPEDKVKTVLFLPPNPERKGEGGLRKRGYFKYSYEIENRKWYACDFRGKRLFEVEPPDGFDTDLEKFKGEDGIIKLPLVTVITVVLNGKKYLEQTIRSVIHQTYPNVEYIIIDGGSTDGTIDIIKKYENQIDYWVSEPDKGIYDAMNKGVESACGMWINFMNSGDYFMRIRTIFELSSFLLTTPDIVAGQAITDCGKVFPYYNCETSLFSWISIANKAYVSHQGSFISKNAFCKLGYYDTTYKLRSDFDFFLKAVVKKFDLLRLNIVVVVYNTEGISSKLVNRIKFKLEERRSVVKILGPYYGISHRILYELLFLLTLPVYFFKKLVSYCLRYGFKSF